MLFSISLNVTSIVMSICKPSAISKSNDTETLSLYLPRSILLKLLTLMFARFASSFCDMSLNVR